MLRVRRKLVRIGGSEGVTLPKELKKGPEVTYAGNRLLLMDPRGEVSAEDLLEFVERFVEPALSPWLEERLRR